jgi:hypothetical protein
MSLNFDFSKVFDCEAVTTDPADPQSWHPVADALVWLSLQCGFSEISHKNVDKVINRIMAYQVVLGAYLGQIYIMPVDIRRFVGMRTNATRLTDAQWHRRLGRITDEVGTHLARRLEREQRPGALVEIARRAAQTPPKTA